MLIEKWKSWRHNRKYNSYKAKTERRIESLEETIKAFKALFNYNGYSDEKPRGFLYFDCFSIGERENYVELFGKKIVATKGDSWKVTTKDIKEKKNK